MSKDYEGYQPMISPKPEERDDDAAVAALLALAAHNIPADVQELLVYGNLERGIRPGALSKALRAALLVYDESTK